MSNITKHQGLAMQTMSDMKAFATAAHLSGFLGPEGDRNTAVAKAVMKIQYGAELGLGPMQSIQGVQVIQGKPTLSAGTIATLVKRSEKYNYRVTEHTDEECNIVFYENGAECGSSNFTLKDAQKAGLTGNQTWKKYARNMLFARALSNGARWYCSDVFAGSVYTPEEIDEAADVSAGEPIVITRNVTPEPEVDEDGVVSE